eukprot:TRINITY_DN38337_c0_g4_i1.p1 TRINITY_DN38337_c0_g4~~TRINITY_DN38337_c0_g4_i1.p1  ORF type:complete len:1106 (-),score=322.44 TRINITY_DN38337_c0_g4_i1:283-3600(-)
MYTPRALPLVVYIISWPALEAVRAPANGIGGSLIGIKQKLEKSDPTEYECCCKEGNCKNGATGDDNKTPARYFPDQDKCCKLKPGCEGFLNLLRFSAYRHKASNPAMCTPEFEEVKFEDPMDELDKENHTEVAPIVENPSTPTQPQPVDEFCELGSVEDPEDVQDDPIDDTDKKSRARISIINALIQELSGNSLDSMAKEIFGIYVCVRWAPSPDFQAMARGEVNAELLEEKDAFEHYKDNRFIPLRCSRNLQVYEHMQSGKTNFEMFEAAMDALSQWFSEQDKGVVASRLDGVQGAKLGSLKGLSDAFDFQRVKEAVKKCGPTSDHAAVNGHKASTEELLGDCNLARWWLAKLQDWHSALPFTSFMTPTHKVKEAAPKENEHVLVCFGKRVASQLHRRDGGSHLMTDQSAVGCHGFWDLPTASKMLARIVKLWRPPTCQLAAMELDMKTKIMEMTATINTELFNALPGMMGDEMDDDSTEGLTLQKGGGFSALAALGQGILSAFAALKGKYARLGQLLGDTTVKWVVCPVKKTVLADKEKTAKLDSQLGTEDDLARVYAKDAAYKHILGEEVVLPGEECESSQDVGINSCSRCSLGMMRENNPEPYKNEEFICPIRAFLPAKQQFREVFMKRMDTCLLRMTGAQMDQQNWHYRGHKKQLKQYDKVENKPDISYDLVKVHKISGWFDERFNIWRDFVTIAKRCSKEEAEHTPRWCNDAPELLNPKSTGLLAAVEGTAGGIAAVGGGIVDVATLGLEAAGAIEKQQRNSLTTNRIGEIMYGWRKDLEKALRGSWTENIVGNSKDRYARLHGDMFDVVEANEVLHSMSFQRQLPLSRGNTSRYEKFDRYAVTCGCKNFEPDVELTRRYAWGEHSLNLLRKAFETKNSILDNAAIRIQIASAAALEMTNKAHAWVSYSAHWRAAPSTSELPQWVETRNPFLVTLAGSSSTGGTVSMDDIYGFEAVYQCGTREEMYKLPLDSDTGAKKNLKQCILDGKVGNAARREKNPTQTFFKDDVVVRVVFKPLPECSKDRNAAAFDAEEVTNPVASAFKDTLMSCQATTVPDNFAPVMKKSSFRAIMVGSGVPKDTLRELLLDPAEVATDFGLKA